MVLSKAQALLRASSVQAAAGSTAGDGELGRGHGCLPSGIIKMNKVPVIPKLGEHLIMVAVHVSCNGGERSEQGFEGHRSE